MTAILGSARVSASGQDPKNRPFFPHIKERSPDSASGNRSMDTGIQPCGVAHSRPGGAI